MKSIKTDLKNAQSDAARNYYKNRLFVQTDNYAKALGIKQSELETLINNKGKIKIKTDIKSNHITNVKQNKTFVNSFGEATTRNITNATYERQQKKLQKELMRFIGGK